MMSLICVLRAAQENGVQAPADSLLKLEDLRTQTCSNLATAFLIQLLSRC